jgi:hypothetical protein
MTVDNDSSCLWERDRHRYRQSKKANVVKHHRRLPQRMKLLSVLVGRETMNEEPRKGVVYGR